MKSQPLFTAILFCLSHAATLMAAEGEFASNNYYLRLSQATGIDRQRLTTHGKSTEKLWSGLRAWLQLNNHALGKPTAVATTTWVYVGKAMSQAVVRAADRIYFHDLFEKFGFTGNENISSKEMEHYLSYWMGSTASGPRLKKVWKREDLRERVAEAAVAELAVWSSSSGEKLGGSSSRSTKLSLFADIVPSFPHKALEVHLGRMSEGDESSAYNLPGDTEKFFLTNEIFGSVATVSPSPFGKRGEGLSNAFHFSPIAPNSGAKLEWQPRLIIPLAMRSQVNMWMETPRVSFGSPHMLLVRDAKDLPAQVELYLAGVCASVPSRANSEQLQGLSPGWVLYQNVEVRKLIEPPHEELECLMPLGAEGALDIVGGLQLVPNFYHTSSKPSVTFVAPSGPTIIEASDDEDEEPLVRQRSDDGACTLDLEAKNFRTGSAFVRACQQGQKPTTKQVFFRSANTPQPLSQNLKGRLSYRSILSASPVTDEMEVNVEGLTVSGEFPALQAQEYWAPSRLPEGEGEDHQVAVHSSALQAHGSAQVCVERGYHITVLPEVPQNTPGGTPFEGRCSSCKRREIVIYRRRLRMSSVHALPRLELPAVKVSTRKNDQPIDYEMLVDALCFLGQGNWARFKTIIEYWGEGTKHPRQVAHELFLLGLIDIELRPGTNSVKAWSVPQASINFIDEKLAFLAGFRSRSLVSSIRNFVQAAGGRLDVEDIDGRPPLVIIKGLDAAKLANELASLKDPLLREVLINVDAGRRIASACDELQGVHGALIPVSIGRAKNLQRFDPARAKWTDQSEVRGAGAYRWNDGIQCYAYRFADGQAVAGPYQVIKTIAASEEGLSLHMYEASNRRFLSTLGCEPPGLLERALVACSGQLPTIAKGISSYQGISADVAAQVIKHIYTESVGHEERQSNQRH